MAQERANAFDFWGPCTIQHVEYVPVGGQAPNYDAALTALKELA